MALLPIYDEEAEFRMLVKDFDEFERLYMTSVHRPSPYSSAAMNRIPFSEHGQISNDYEKFQVYMDVHHFKPDEISVTVVDGYVVVEGNHTEKKDQHGYISRQFVRRYVLPKGYLPDTVESKLSSDGVLIITAPKVLAMPSTGERIVPVKFTGPIR